MTIADPPHRDQVDALAWCGRPPTEDERAEAARRLAALTYGRQVQEYARDLLRRAAVARGLLDAQRSSEAADGRPGDVPGESTGAPAGANGVVAAWWGTGRYRGWRALVCLDCGWVGSIRPLFPREVTAADTAEATWHPCEVVRW